MYHSTCGRWSRTRDPAHPYALETSHSLAWSWPMMRHVYSEIQVHSRELGRFGMLYVLRILLVDLAREDNGRTKPRTPASWIWISLAVIHLIHTRMFISPQVVWTLIVWSVTDYRKAFGGIFLSRSVWSCLRLFLHHYNHFGDGETPSFNYITGKQKQYRR